MRMKSILPYYPVNPIEQKLTSFIHDSKQLQHINHIHAYLLKTSLHSNNFIITKLLSKLSFNSFDNLRYAHHLFDEMPSPDTFLYNTMIRAHLNSHNYNECLSLFLQLCRQDHLFIDSFSLSLVVQACGRSGFVGNGQTVHTQVLKLGFGCDLFVQTGLTEMYVKFGWVEFARKVFDDMPQRDLVSYNVLLAEYVRIGELGLARKLFDEMSRRDLVSWNTMIHGYTSLGSVGMSTEAIRLFNEMRLAKIFPDNITIVSVLSACGDLGALGTGKMVHRYIERNRIEIDVKLGTSLVNMYAKCGDIDNALKVFNGLKDKDVFLWSAMITGLANHGYGDVALDHFHAMRSEGVKPNSITFIGVLSACSHTGLVNDGWKYFNLMSDAYGLEPEVEHYGCMVDILCRAGRLHAARNVIRNMPFKPDARIWRTVLGACKIYKNVELAEEATSEIRSLEAHDDGNYVLLSSIYSQDNKWDKAVNIRRKMDEISIQKVVGNSSVEVDNAV
ncbi:putative tetratricopeptide-like helical domain superfamily [Helianthus anomalus]